MHLKTIFMSSFITFCSTENKKSTIRVNDEMKIKIVPIAIVPKLFIALYIAFPKVYCRVDS